MFYQEVLFTEEECKKIVDLTKELPKINGKNKYGNNNSEVSFDEYKIEDTNENSWFMNKIKAFIEKKLKIKINFINNDVHILSYGINDGFSKHIDYDPNGDEPRVYTVGLLLNNEFEGGNLLIYDIEKIILNKVIGNCYIFDTTTPHEVEKIINGKRYAIILHIKNSEIQKNNLL
jgi:predicted 2-oxoglutarate/Fe(II)-dependent dioxygenase YbiX